MKKVSAVNYIKEINKLFTKLCLCSRLCPLVYKIFDNLCFKANFIFSDDSDVINAFVATCNVVICCATSSNWPEVFKAGNRSLIVLERQGATNWF